MRRLVLDLDDVLASVAEEDNALCKTIQAYRDRGFEIVLSHASLLLNDGGLPPDLVSDSLDAIASLCDSVVFGKPAAGSNGLVLDDKAVTPEEFMAHGYNELRDMMDKS